MNMGEPKLLEDIKRLLIVLLLKLGALSEEIGVALRLHPGAARKIVPGRKIKKISALSE